MLGIDPGSLVTGYGLIRKARSGIECLDFGCVRPARGQSLPQRLEQIHAALRDEGFDAEFVALQGAPEHVISEIAADKKEARAAREIEGGTEIVTCPLPALFTAQKGLNEPRYAAVIRRHPG